MNTTGQCSALLRAVFGLSIAVCSVGAQTDLRIALRHSSAGLSVSWPSKSLVPSPGAQAFGLYRVNISSNLVDWIPLEEKIRGIDFADKTIERPIASGLPQLFVKVETLLHFSGLDLTRFPLANGHFAQAQFVGCSFFQANLTQANLSDADLEAADFRLAVLSGANLARANALGSDFSTSTLNKIDARDADLSYCDFSGADLTAANLSGADLRFTTFSEAAMDLVALQRTTIDDRTVFPPKIETVWKLANNKLPGQTVAGRDLTGCNLEEADLSGISFGSTDLRNSALQRAKLAGANLQNALLDFVDWRGVEIDSN